jgi:hypothetical protein
MVLDNNSNKTQSASQRWRLSSNLYSRLLSNKTVTTSWQDLTKLPSLDWGQDTTESTNIWTESWKSYHPRCAVQCKIPPHLTNMNHQALREEAITNNTPGEALWTHGCPTEDHQIRSGNWNLSVKANEKKNLTQTGILLIKSIQSLLIYCSLTSNQHYFSQLIDWL